MLGEEREMEGWESNKMKMKEEEGVKNYWWRQLHKQRVNKGEKSKYKNYNRLLSVSLICSLFSLAYDL